MRESELSTRIVERLAEFRVSLRFLWCRHIPEVAAISLHDYSDESFRDMLVPYTVWSRVGEMVGRSMPFILGEFGPPTSCDHCYCMDGETMALWVPQKTLAVIAAGGYATAFWLFSDLPHGGCFGGAMVDFFSNHTDSCQPVYYSYGLLSRFFRGPADSYALIRDVTNASNVPVACVRQHDSGLWSVAALNMDFKPLSLALQLPAAAKSISMYRFTYTFGDAEKGIVSNCSLPHAQKQNVSVGGTSLLGDSLAPRTLVVYSEYL